MNRQIVSPTDGQILDTRLSEARHAELEFRAAWKLLKKIAKASGQDVFIVQSEIKRHIEKQEGKIPF